ncbi:MAG: NTP transferase domain-containing protein [Myxococcales bacterium]|nr:NTP transferase domain-containing protein [Myxococcales bacterium]
MERVGGLILAGGASTRMGRPKALLCIEGETFMARLVRLFAAAGCDPIAVVVGADAAVLAPAVPAPAFAVHAIDWAAGMRASLRAGLAALPPGPVLLTHVDRPIIDPTTLATLVAATTNRPVIPTHRGEPGHPVRLPAGLRARLLEADDTPLRELLAAAPALTLPVDDPGVLLNLNTPADFAAVTGID